MNSTSRTGSWLVSSTAFFSTGRATSGSLSSPRVNWTEVLPPGGSPRARTSTRTRTCEPGAAAGGSSVRLVMATCGATVPPTSSQYACTLPGNSSGAAAAPSHDCRVRSDNTSSNSSGASPPSLAASVKRRLALRSAGTTDPCPAMRRAPSICCRARFTLPQPASAGASSAPDNGSPSPRKTCTRLSGEKRSRSCPSRRLASSCGVVCPCRTPMLGLRSRITTART